MKPDFGRSCTMGMKAFLSSELKRETVFLVMDIAE